MSDKIVKNIIVKTDVENAYRIWSDFENFPMFMEHVKSVRKGSDDKSYWQVKGPLGTTVEWIAETTVKEENKRLGWSTKDMQGDITTSGQVLFNPLPKNETDVTLTFKIETKGGVAVDLVEKLFANPEKKIEEDLRNFKAYVEGRQTRTDLG